MEITIRISDRTPKIGAVVLGVFVVISLSIYLLVSEVFAAQYRLRMNVAGVPGIGVGAPVTLSGIDVGTEASIKFAQNPSSPTRKIELVLHLEKR
jgi:ABC-type transporter Mla subunit MlaD